MPPLKKINQENKPQIYYLKVIGVYDVYLIAGLEKDNYTLVFDAANGVWKNIADFEKNGIIDFSSMANAPTAS